eukprot:TRINITY_DN1736_c0_g1_i1.p1 TRINITY_DN1736_c0_g1~~TRINITY_DN1736_c0_g1_i1.p1  ORF type:complete len:388 (+),score=93.71 TRINITY_DN1736_c0_g1_i1:68-1231(+)
MTPDGFEAGMPPTMGIASKEDWARFLAVDTDTEAGKNNDQHLREENKKLMAEISSLKEQLKQPAAVQQFGSMPKVPQAEITILYSVGEMAQVILLEEPHKGEWIDVLITEVNKDGKTVSIIVPQIADGGIGAKFSGQSRTDIPTTYLRKQPSTHTTPDIVPAIAPTPMPMPLAQHGLPLMTPQQLYMMPMQPLGGMMPVTMVPLASPAPAMMAAAQATPAPVISSPPVTQVKVQFRYGREGICTSVLGVELGAHVIVAMGREGRHQDLGVVMQVAHDVDGNLGNEGRRVLRHATPQEVSKWNGLDVADQEAMAHLIDLVTKNNVPILVKQAEWQFERKTLTFHYTPLTPHPDFRKILKSAYRKFHCRIWMNNCEPKEGEPGERLHLS